MTEKLPTEHMIVAGFEAVSMFQETDAYKDMTGCQGAAESAKVCWAAMVAAMPEGETPRQDKEPSDAEIVAVYHECSWLRSMCGSSDHIKFAREILARYGDIDRRDEITELHAKLRQVQSAADYFAESYFRVNDRLIKIEGIPPVLRARQNQSDKWDLEEDLTELLLAKFESGNEIPVERATITRTELESAFPGFFDEGDK